MDTIHGLSFVDYAATNAFLAQGKGIEELLPTLGVELPQWEEASAHFERAMQNDSTFQLATQLGEIFQNPAQGKYAGGGGDAPSAGGAPKIADLESYLDVQGLMHAATEVGVDPQAMLKERGLTVHDFSEAGMRFMPEINERLAAETEDGNAFREWFTQTNDAAVGRYRAVFKEIAGPGVGDDIEF